MVTYYKNQSGLTHAQNRNEANWISAVCPTPAEKDFLLNELQVPEAFYNDIEDIDERPRIEIENGWHLIIIRIPYKSNDVRLPYTTVPLGLVFKEDVFVSVSFTETELFEDFITYTQRKNIEPRDSFDLVLRLLLSSSIWFQKYLK